MSETKPIKLACGCHAVSGFSDWSIEFCPMHAAAPDLLEACRQIVWKLSHNHKADDYSGPARITRDDATVRLAVAAIAKAVPA